MSGGGPRPSRGSRTIRRPAPYVRIPDRALPRSFRCIHTERWMAHDLNGIHGGLFVISGKGVQSQSTIDSDYIDVCLPMRGVAECW
jgi:hypothetical protein